MDEGKRLEAENNSKATSVGKNSVGMDNLCAVGHTCVTTHTCRLTARLLLSHFILTAELN